MAASRCRRAAARRCRGGKPRLFFLPSAEDLRAVGGVRHLVHGQPRQGHPGATRWDRPGSTRFAGAGARQVFAVGLNYADHAAESGVEQPESPVIFTKFASAISGPVTTVPLPSDTVDWEVELVVVIGRGGRNIPADRAWESVAGLSVGQDLSDRGRQLAGPVPQFSLAKSHRGFAPIGPALVTIDEFADPNDLTLETRINGELVQFGRTAQMIFGAGADRAPVAHPRALPRDVVFTGTPAASGLAGHRSGSSAPATCCAAASPTSANSPRRSSHANRSPRRCDRDTPAHEHIRSKSEGANLAAGTHDRSSPDRPRGTRQTRVPHRRRRPPTRSG